MEILPINAIREEDGPIVGPSIINLAKLGNLGLPLPDGIVVFPPEIEFKRVFRFVSFSDKRIFESNLEILDRELKRAVVPEELVKLCGKKGISIKWLWQNLILAWQEEFKAKLWQEGGINTLSLSPQPVFFTDKVIVSGLSWEDPGSRLVSTKYFQGNLTPKQVYELEALVKKANKKLFLPKIYHWILDKGIKFVKVVPYTDQLPVPFLSQKEGAAPILKERKLATKVFLSLGENLQVEGSFDGALVAAEKTANFDQEALLLTEVATSLPKLPVIFKLSDQVDKFGSIRGTLRLVHTPKLLKKDVEAFLFARHKKGLLNVQIAVPFVRSTEEFLQLKRDLAVLGVSRKGSLRMWLELAVPENIINLEQYLVAGFDGALINLDELACLLGGFDPNEQESVFYKKQAEALIKLLESGMKILHQAKVPSLAYGSLAAHDEVLKFLIKSGIYGIGVDFANAASLKDHVYFLEQRLLTGSVKSKE